MVGGRTGRLNGQTPQPFFEERSCRGAVGGSFPWCSFFFFIMSVFVCILCMYRCTGMCLISPHAFFGGFCGRRYGALVGARVFVSPLNERERACGKKDRSDPRRVCVSGKMCRSAGAGTTRLVSRSPLTFFLSSSLFTEAGSFDRPHRVRGGAWSIFMFWGGDFTTHRREDWASGAGRRRLARRRLVLL